MNPLIRQVIGESQQTNENAVIVKQRPVDYYVCPHCHEEIHEKGTYSDDNGDTSRHRACGGVVEYPETPDDQIADWLRPHVQKAREERKARQAAQTPPPKGFVVGDTTGTSLP